MTASDTKFEYNVDSNYSSPTYIEEHDAVYLSVTVTRDNEHLNSHTYVGLSPTEARELADALNVEAAAAEKHLGEKKYPKEDGWYLLGDTPFRKTGKWWYTAFGNLAAIDMVKQRVDEYGFKKMTVEHS